jgi:diaminopimelate epimerase
VVLEPDVAAVAVAEIGGRLDADEPGGLNVEFVSAGPGPEQATMRVWERGVGETLACGTGCCAAAVALRHWGLAGTRLTVHQPGGTVDVVTRDDGSIVLAGPSRRIGAVQVRLEDLPA